LVITSAAWLRAAAQLNSMLGFSPFKTGHNARFPSGMIDRQRPVVHPRESKHILTMYTLRNTLGYDSMERREGSMAPETPRRFVSGHCSMHFVEQLD
jgi:hypothetical protein